MNTHPASPHPPERGAEAIVRGSVWAFIGALYGVLFSLFLIFAQRWQTLLDPGFVAAALAGAASALIYGSMRLAMIVASAVSAMCVLLFVNAGGGVTATLLLSLVLPVGALIGAVYGGFMRPSPHFGSDSSRIYRADAKTLAGLLAGTTAALLVPLAKSVFGTLPLGWMVALLVIVTGFLYVNVVPLCLTRCGGLLPPAADGALVGTAAAGFVALFMFVMISSLEPQLAGPLAERFAECRAVLPAALTGGLLGGGVAGVVGALLLNHWQDL